MTTRSENGSPARAPRRGTRPGLAFISSVALVVWTALLCDPPPDVRIVSPVAGVGATYEPLWIEIEFWFALDASTLEVWLNGVDISDQFELGEPIGTRQLATAIDVWGDAVLEGPNELFVRIQNRELTLVFDAVGDPHADDVLDFSPGTGAGFGQSELPDVVTGPPQGLGLFLGGLDVLSVGAGGVVDLEFVDNVIVDGPGVDFTVFENPFLTAVLGVVGNPFAEPGRVSVSQDGLVWYAFACATPALQPPFHPGCAGVFPTLSDALDPEAPHPSIPTVTPISALVGLPLSAVVIPDGSGGDSFDLMDVGLTWARYVRVQHVGPALGQAGTVGLDLDAISAVNSAPPVDDDEDGIPDAVE